MAMPPRVLIVDDERGLVDTMQSILRRRGCHAECALDGIEAVDRVRQHHFDFVLMDIRMPRLDGVAAMRAICADPDPPLVALMTAYSAPAVIEEALAAGALDVLGKPVDFPRVFELLARVRVRPSVLVIDADAAFVASVTHTLRAHGRAVRAARGLAEAYLLCAPRPLPIADVVLLDAGIPGKNLAAVVAALRAMANGPAVIVTTSEPRADTEALPCTVLEKPIAAAALLAAVDDLLPRPGIAG